MSAPLVPIVLAFALGILARACLPCGWLWPLLLGPIGALGVFCRRDRWGVAAVCVTWCCLGMLRAHVWLRHPEHGLAARVSSEPQQVQLYGEVADDPRQMREAHGQCSWTMRLQDIRTEEGWRPIRGRVRVASPRPQTVRYGDGVLLEGAWSSVPAPSNPGQYDWRAALARQRIHAVLHLHSSDAIVVLDHGQGRWWNALIYRLSDAWERLIRQNFRGRDAGLLLSLLLGERVALDEQLKRAFVETGTMHLLVISGCNVALVAGLLEFCFRLIGLPWRVRLLLTGMGLGAYCLLTGLQPPVVRATLMAWLVLGGLAFDRVISWPNLLAAAGLVMLLISPFQLFEPGFQLSFGAVWSLLLFARDWGNRLAKTLGWLRPAWLRAYLVVGVSTTSAVWVGLAPVLAWYFHLVSPVSILANLLIAPLMSALVSLGTAALLFGTWAGVVVRWSAGPLAWLLHATLWCVTWCQTLPGACIWVAHPSPWLLAGYYGLLAALMAGGRAKRKPVRMLICWMAGLTCWVWSGVVHQHLEARWLRVDVLDVGHGDCILVRTPRGHALLIDAGSEEAGRARVVPYLRFLGISTLDGLVLTHPDTDHLGGAIPVLEQLRVRRLLTNGVVDDTMSARRVERLAAQQGLRSGRIAAGDAMLGDGAVEIAVLHPPHGLVPGAEPASNDNSVVLKVRKGAISFLLTGDIEEAGVPWLMRDPRVRDTTVLKVPHHGSRLGEAGVQLFNAAHPLVAILSVGRLHHLPVPETMRALSRTGAMVLSTREQGAVQCKTDGTLLEVRTAAGQVVRTRVAKHDERAGRF